MDLRQLAALLAVAEHGSFSAAARAIHTVQSNVSTHIARLEKELGAVLVDRSSGGLTEEGEAAVIRARRVRSEIDGLAADIAAFRDEVVGSARIGVIGSIARWLAPGMLRAMHDTHPGVEVVIVDATTTSLIPLLRDGSIDQALVNLPVNDPDIGVDPLFEEERILVAPVDHPLARSAEVSLTELARHKLILEPRGTAFRDELDSEMDAVGLELQPMAVVDGMMLVVSLAARGFGPAILPTTATFTESAGSWVRIPVPDLRRRVVGLARRRDTRLAAPSRAVRAVLEAVLAEEAPGHDGVELA